MSDAWSSSHGPARSWRSGPWALELRDDELADITYDGVVLFRAVRAVVRDRNWDTLATVVKSLAEEPAALELRVQSEGFGSSIAGTVRVEATGDELIVSCDLRPTRPLATNRTGLVVLHPPFLAGTPIRVRHPNAREDEARFPEAISPHQPLRDIAGLAWPQAGLAVEATFEGDVFEMEDQRNWTDASYKTYSRPLDLPFPYRIEAGEHVRQVIRIAVRRTEDAPARSRLGHITLAPSGAAFPRIGLAAATAPDPAPAVAVRASHLLVELDLATRAWPAALARAAASGLPLDVRLVLDARPAALEQAAAALAAHHIVRTTAFQGTGPAAHVSDADAIDRLRAALRATGIDVPVVGGARSHFTELNREHHRLPNELDGLVFSITPLFHALSTEQLVESIAIQRLIAEQAVAIAQGRPVHVGPITLRPRFNNVATAPPPRSPHADLREGYGPQLIDADDARQSAPELAAWTVASVAALTVAGVASLTYFEEWGPRGIRATTGEPYPVAAAVDTLRDLESGDALTGASPDGLLWAVGARTGDRDTILLANLDRRHRDLTVTTPAGTHRARLDALSWRRLQERPTLRRA